MQISTFNCRSIKSNVHCVRELCAKSDIICLQETWLPVQELNYLSHVDDNFSFYGTSPVDLSLQLLVGRPYGGVAFLYRKTLAASITRVPTSDDRLICVDINTNATTLRIINCYLPYDNSENDVEYVDYLAKIHCLMNDHPDNNVLTIGDFNAHPQSRFGNELLNFCNDYNYVVGDVNVLPDDTYTWVSDASGHTRWLDHVICPVSLLPRLQNLHIDHDLIGSDHRALCLSLATAQPPPTVESIPSNRLNHVVRDTDKYYTNTEKDLKNIVLPVASLTCRDISCCDGHHVNEIQTYYNDIIRVLLSSGETSRAPQHYVEVPGWNDLVSECHREARACYIQWRNHGKPRAGTVYWEMTQSRIDFKRALKNCKRQREEIIDNNIASNLHGDSKKFWKEINKKKNDKIKLSDNIGDAHGSNAICDVWKSHYSHMFNDDTHPSINPILRTVDGRTESVTVHDVNKAIKAINTSSSPGHDGITPGHLIHAHPLIGILLSLFFTCCFNHSFLPEALMKVVIFPLVKDKHGDICNISNYRPISLSTVSSKILEAVILDRCSVFLGTSDNQFAYKQSHGTDMAIALLKNVTQEYTNRNTPLYSCFMDMSKAFDKVCHAYLFDIMLKRGVPSHVISLLQKWYSSQKMTVRWGDALSGEFTVSCGVKQGSLLSPHLFNLYLDELSYKINKCKIGCVINDRIVNHLIYADDIVVFSPSMSGLQCLVDVCSDYISAMKMTINTVKTKCILHCNRRQNTCPLSSITINNINL